MKEFMFFIRKETDSSITLAPETHLAFLKQCELYINNLKKEGKLIAAQPIERNGNIISCTDSVWDIKDFSENKEVIGGYYHILAQDMEEAILIAKANPEFAFNPGSRIEVRPIKTKESTTGFNYPTKK